MTRAISPMILLLVMLSQFVGIGWAATSESPSFDRALAAIKADKNIPEAIAALDFLARQGDTRSRLLLGTMYLEGRGVAQDRALGFALIRLGADGDDAAFNESVRKQIDELTRKYEMALTGKELIRADQLAAEITAEFERGIAAAVNDVIGLYTPLNPVDVWPTMSFDAESVRLTVPSGQTDAPYLRLGCAGAPHQGCPKAKVQIDAAHCTGEIVRADQPPSLVGPGAYIAAPEYPPVLRRTGVAGKVSMLAHVDASGLVCSVVVATSSGNLLMDAAAVDAVRGWRFQPASKSGKPVESLHTFATVFRLTR